MIPSYSLKSLHITPGLVLSPMSGVTTSAFRRLIKEINPGAIGLMETEFVSVEALTRQSKNTFRMMRFREEERPVGIQIFGYDIERMADGAKIAEDTGADVIDINCGCPAPKVVKKGGGCELMRQPTHLAKVLKAVRNSVTKPLTMKIRSGWDDESINALEIAKIAEEEGIEAIAIHPRTRKQLYRGQANWNIVRNLVQSVKIPILGSGDVFDFTSAEEKLSSGVKGLFIGRGAISNPLIFSEIINKKKSILKNDAQLTLSIIRRYIELLDEDFPSKAICGKLKQLVSQMARGHEFRKEILRALKLQEIMLAIGRAENNLDSNYIKGETSAC